MKKLPKKFQGAEVVRGRGMKSEELDRLVDREALDHFDATLDETWVVVDEKCLENDDFPSTDIRAFASKAHAITYAKAMGNGNVDHRVLCVTRQVFVIATDNEL